MADEVGMTPDEVFKLIKTDPAAPPEQEKPAQNAGLTPQQLFDVAYKPLHTTSAWQTAKDFGAGMLDAAVAKKNEIFPKSAREQISDQAGKVVGGAANLFDMAWDFVVGQGATDIAIVPVQAAMRKFIFGEGSTSYKSAVEFGDQLKNAPYMKPAQKLLDLIKRGHIGEDNPVASTMETITEGTKALEKVAQEKYGAPEGAMTAMINQWMALLPGAKGAYKRSKGMERQEKFREYAEGTYTPGDRADFIVGSPKPGEPQVAVPNSPFQQKRSHDIIAAEIAQRQQAASDAAAKQAKETQQRYGGSGAPTEPGQPGTAVVPFNPVSPLEARLSQLPPEGQPSPSAPPSPAAKPRIRSKPADAVPVEEAPASPPAAPAAAEPPAAQAFEGAIDGTSGGTIPTDLLALLQQSLEQGRKAKGEPAAEVPAPTAELKVELPAAPEKPAKPTWREVAEGEEVDPAAKIRVDPKTGKTFVREDAKPAAPAASAAPAAPAAGKPDLSKMTTKQLRDYMKGQGQLAETSKTPRGRQRGGMPGVDEQLARYTDADLKQLGVTREQMRQILSDERPLDVSKLLATGIAGGGAIAGGMYAYRKWQEGKAEERFDEENYNPDTGNPLAKNLPLMMGIFYPIRKGSLREKIAQNLEKSGKTPEQIWKTPTGVEGQTLQLIKGADGRWYEEMSDHDLRLGRKVRENKTTGKMEVGTGSVERLGDVATHEKLYDRYPGMEEAPVQGVPEQGPGGTRARFLPETQGYEFAPNFKNQLLDTFVHELQHGVGKREGFSFGSHVKAHMAPDNYIKAKEVARDIYAMVAKDPGLGLVDIDSATGAIDSILKGERPEANQMKHLERAHKSPLWPEFNKALAEWKSIGPEWNKAYDAYRADMGEEFARLAARRRKLTPEERAQEFPKFETPIDKQTVDPRYNQPTMQSDFPIFNRTPEVVRETFPKTSRFVANHPLLSYVETELLKQAREIKDGKRQYFSMPKEMEDPGRTTHFKARHPGEQDFSIEMVQGIDDLIPKDFKMPDEVRAEIAVEMARSNRDAFKFEEEMWQVGSSSEGRFAWDKPNSLDKEIITSWLHNKAHGALESGKFKEGEAGFVSPELMNIMAGGSLGALAGAAFTDPGDKMIWAGIGAAVGMGLASKAGKSLAQKSDVYRSAEKGMAGVIEDFWRKFNPDMLGPNAEAASAVLGSHYADMLRRHVKEGVEGRERHKFFETLSDAELKQFRMGLELGVKFKDPTWQQYAQEYRKMASEILIRDTNLGIKYDPLDYFIFHMVKEPGAATQYLANKYGKGWDVDINKKAATYLNDLENAGFDLIYKNPEEIMKARLYSSDLAKLKIDSLQQLADFGVAREKVRGTFLQAGETVWRAPNGKEYYLPDHANQVFHNAFDSRSLWDDTGFAGISYRGTMWAKNAIVPWKLLSLFHPLHVELGMNSGTNGVNAIKSWAAGNMSAGAAAATTLGRMAFPVDAISRLRYMLKDMQPDGMKAYRGDLDPAKMTPEIQRQMQLALDGGFIPEMSAEYKNAHVQAFFDAASRAKSGSLSGLVRTGFEAPFALLEQYWTRPVFENWIPAMKWEAYQKSAVAHMAANPDLASKPLDRMMALRKISKMIDDRFGEMQYKTLFMDRLYKDVMVASFLSYGWQYGFARSYLGAFPEAARAFTENEPFAGRGTMRERIAKGEFDKTLFLGNYLMATMMYGGLMTYALSGDLPKDIMDYIYPRTGEKNPDGTDARVSTPFYTREFVSIPKHMQEHGAIGGLGITVANKLTPVLGLVGGLVTNKDFFNREISDPDASFTTRMWQKAAFVAGELEPISSSAPRRSGKMEVKDYALAAAGFAPAPKYVTEAPEEALIKNYLKYHRPRVTPYERAVRGQEIYQLYRLKQAGKNEAYEEGLAEVTRKYKLNEAQVDRIRREADVPVIYKQFKILNASEQRQVLSKMKPEDRKRFQPYSRREVRDELERQ